MKISDTVKIPWTLLIITGWFIYISLWGLYAAIQWDEEQAKKKVQHGH